MIQTTTDQINGRSQQQQPKSTQSWDDAAANQTAVHQPMPEHAYASETQSPTHDALSAIYNRDYRE